MKGKIYWGRATFLQTSKSVSQPTKGSKGLAPWETSPWIGMDWFEGKICRELWLFHIVTIKYWNVLTIFP